MINNDQAYQVPKDGEGNGEGQVQTGHSYELIGLNPFVIKSLFESNQLFYESNNSRKIQTNIGLKVGVNFASFI